MERGRRRVVFPSGAGGKEPACQCRRCQRPRFDPWVGKVSWKRKWLLTPVFCLGNLMERRARRATVHKVTKSWTRLKRLNTHAQEVSRLGQEKQAISEVWGYWGTAGMLGAEEDTRRRDRTGFQAPESRLRSWAGSGSPLAPPLDKVSGFLPSPSFLLPAAFPCCLLWGLCWRSCLACHCAGPCTFQRSGSLLPTISQEEMARAGPRPR